MSDFCGEAGLPDFDAPSSSTPAPTTSAAGEATPEDVLRYYLNREESRLSSDSRSHDASAIEALRSALSSLAALREQLEQAKEDQRLFGEVMALMNGDGGHYQAEHGSMAAFDRAVARWEERYRRMDSAEYALTEAQAALKRANELGCTVAENGKWTEEEWSEHQRITRQPDSSALNTFIEAATAKQDLPTAATLSASEQPRKETGEARRVIGGIIIPSAPPLGVIDALRAFVTAVYNYEETGVWPDNGTIRLLAEQGKNALEGIGRNLSLSSPSQHATGVSSTKESGAPSRQTAGVASQEAGQP